METLTGWRSPHGFAFVFMFLTTVGRGSTCEAPSSPQCFRRKSNDSVYLCEWNLNTTESHVKYDLFVHCLGSSPCHKKFGSIEKTSHRIMEEELIKYRPVNIWVEAHVGNITCSSSRRSVVLNHTVKYEVPRGISMSWSQNNLTLSWTVVEGHPALAEVRYRRNEHPTESWEYRLANTTIESSNYRLIVVNLLKYTAYRVQIRHRSNQALNPLWSDWSPLVIVPAALEQIPEVNFTTRLVNGTRNVMLTWKPAPHAAAVSGITYSVQDVQSSGCPCKEKPHHTEGNKHIANVSYSAVNISVMAKNAAGYSPPVIIQVPAVLATDLRACQNTSLKEKFKKGTCLQLYELRDGDPNPKEVITLTAKTHKQKTVKDYTRYLYFKHRCHDEKPQTVKMCLFYHKEGVPHEEPLDFSSFSETQSSVTLSWKAIPSEMQRGFLTHHSLCIRKIYPQDELEACHNISASLIKYQLENLTPGAKYNITLAGVTREGEGPRATMTINTLPEKHENVLPLSLGLLFLVAFVLPLSTCFFTRIKSKIFPPVPTPVILNFTSCQPESQRMMERKEEVDELMLQQPHSEVKSAPRDPQETTVLSKDWDVDTEVEGSHSRLSGGPSDDCSSDLAPRDCREAETTDLEQVDNEITMLIYRNGLVFDMKTDSA